MSKQDRPTLRIVSPVIPGLVKAPPRLDDPATFRPPPENPDPRANSDNRANRTSKLTFASRPPSRPRTANGHEAHPAPAKPDGNGVAPRDSPSSPGSLRSKSTSAAPTLTGSGSAFDADALQGRSQSATSFVASPSRSRPTAFGEAFSKHSRGASRILASIKATASRSTHNNNKHATSSSHTPPPPPPPPPPQKSRRASYLPDFIVPATDHDATGRTKPPIACSNPAVKPINNPATSTAANAESDSSLPQSEAPSSTQNQGQTKTKQPRLHHFLSRSRSIRALDDFFHSSNGSSSINTSPNKTTFAGDANPTSTSTPAIPPNHPYKHGFGHSRVQSIYPAGGCGRFADSTTTISEIPTEDEAAEEQQYVKDNQSKRRDAQPSDIQTSLPPPSEVDSEFESGSPLSDTVSHSPTLVTPPQQQQQQPQPQPQPQAQVSTGKNNVTETVISEDELPSTAPPPVPSKTPATLPPAAQNVSNGKKFTHKAKGILDWMLPGVSSDPGRAQPPSHAPEENVLSVINLPLHEQVRRTRIGKRLNGSKDKTEYWLPALPFRCIDYLNSKAEMEGLYRIPGSHRDVMHWKKRFDEGK